MSFIAGMNFQMPKICLIPPDHAYLGAKGFKGYSVASRAGLCNGMLPRSADRSDFAMKAQDGSVASRRAIHRENQFLGRHRREMIEVECIVPLRVGAFLRWLRGLGGSIRFHFR